MKWKYLFTAQSETGWRTVIQSKGDQIEIDGGSYGRAILSIKDIRQIVRLYNKAKKEQK
jgi:hypothetical protein